MSFEMFELHYRWWRRCWHLFERGTNHTNWCHFLKIKTAPKQQNALFFVVFNFSLSLFLYLYCRDRYLAQKNMSEKWMQSSSTWAKNIYIYICACCVHVVSISGSLAFVSISIPPKHVKCKWKNIIIITIIIFCPGVNKNIFALHMHQNCKTKNEREQQKKWSENGWREITIQM